MKRSIHIIMPMAGEGKRFKDAGYEIPKPLIKVEDKEIYRHAQDSLLIDGIKRTFIVRAEHINQFEIDKNILMHYPNSNIVISDKLTNGPLETIMLAEKYIDDNDMVISLDCDIRFICNNFNYNIIKKVKEKNIIPMVLSFYSTNNIYSYILPHAIDHNYGILLVEKNPITNYALGGCYCLGDGKTFKLAANKMIKDFYDGNLNSKELYISLVYNYIMKMKNCKTQIIDMNMHEDRYWSFGTPEDIQNYKYENNIWDK